MSLSLSLPSSAFSERYEPPRLTTGANLRLAERRALAALPLPDFDKRPDVPRSPRPTLAIPPCPVPISYDVQTRVWTLLGDYWIVSGGSRLTAPQGMRFDLASIPRELWWLIAPNEMSIVAPLFHDYLYRCRGDLGHGMRWCDPYRRFTRAEVDALFLQVMEMEGVGEWRRLAAYSGIRAAGALFWKD